MKIFIPEILCFAGEQLTEENLENFKKLVFHGWGSKFTTAYTGDRLSYVSFYWGDNDYPDYVAVKINQYFLFNTEDENQYLVINKIEDNWKVVIDKKE